MEIVYDSGTFSYQEMNAVQAKLHAAKSVLAERERELLMLKGPCSNKACPLHYAHSGPCDVKGTN